LNNILCFIIGGGMMRVTDTRRGDFASAARAINEGIAPSGGLYVPERFPVWTLEKIRSLVSMPYANRAVAVLRSLLPDFSPGELERAVLRTYNSEKFESPAVAPITKIDNSTYILELYHGPTLAFKDFALQLLPSLMTISSAAERSDEKRLVLTATSGDTGKAALESFADQPGTACVVFYPERGVSEVQRLQMVTQRGANTFVAAVRGDFDDAQTGVKRLFGDRNFQARMRSLGWSLTSANSINFGRLIPQIAYYFSAYAELVHAGRIKTGDPVDFAVPTGNFGNILACDYARRMGLPVGKLICASNENHVLADFIETGVYNAKRALRITSSPSMDILISSNLERFLFEITSRDHDRISDLMTYLKTDGRFVLSNAELQSVKTRIIAGWADEASTSKSIADTWKNSHTLIDPHTAVGMAVLSDIRARRKLTGAPVVLASTASPFKFGRDVAAAILDQDLSGMNDFDCLGAIARHTGLAVPGSITNLQNRPIVHETLCDPQQMAETVERFVTSLPDNNLKCKS
jgi:threonine synthase